MSLRSGDRSLPQRALLACRAGLEHLGAGRPLGILQHSVLLHDQGAAQRDHHQYAQQAAQDRHQHHAADLQVEAQDHDRRHGDADAKGDGLAGRAGRLDDVVLQDARVAETQTSREAEQGQGDHRDRDRRAHRQADLEHQIEGRGAEDDSQQHPHDQGNRRQLAQGGLGGNERAEQGRRRGARGGGVQDRHGDLMLTSAHLTTSAGPPPGGAAQAVRPARPRGWEGACSGVRDGASP